MTPSLGRDEVAKVARLARLRLSDAELDTFTEQLGQILEHAKDISALDLTDVEVTAHPYGLVNVVRADDVVASLDRDAVLEMAPDVSEHRFAVPRILEAP